MQLLLNVIQLMVIMSTIFVLNKQIQKYCTYYVQLLYQTLIAFCRKKKGPVLSQTVRSTCSVSFDS
jgi:hypothetical protein